MPKPPGDPDLFDKVNYVIDAWSRPCEAPWYIYVETLKPALLEAFITLIAFGWDDVVRGYLRPKGLGMRRTSKRKGKGVRKLPRFPELGELIGENLPGSDAAKGTRWSDGLKTLWRIDAAIQGVLFAWLVADVTLDLAFNWTSVLYQTRWCEASSKGRFSWRKGTVELISPDVWNEIAYTSKDWEFPLPNWVITFGNIGANGAAIAFSLDLEAAFAGDPPTSFQTRLVDRTTSEVFATNEATPLDPDGKGIAVIQASVPRNRQFKVQVFAAGGWGRATDGAITGFEL